MLRPPLLIIIDNLAKGGAEIMLVDLLPELKNVYEIILVTLADKCDFEEQKIVCDHLYALGFKNKVSFIPCIFRLNKIIKKHKPALIHSHLIYSGIIARMACPSSIPLLYSIHGELSKSDFNKSQVLSLMEKISIRKNHSLLAVSNVVLEDYQKTIRKIYRSFVLHNYISDDYLIQNISPKTFVGLASLRLIAVGNIKAAKNYQYLVESFKYLKDLPVTLDVYGNTDHPLFTGLQAEIDRLKLNIVFRGSSSSIRNQFREHDVFVMCSKNEGFGISVIEAMACGLPVLLSDIPVMREISFQNGLFFNPKNPLSFVDLIKEILEGKNNLNELSINGLSISKKYNKKQYLERLLSLYDELIIECHN
ncbi:MAG: glycosyltransferase [Ginsengibacter sp.]